MSIPLRAVFCSLLLLSGLSATGARLSPRAATPGRPNPPPGQRRAAVASVVDGTPRELEHKLPELKNLQYAQSQEALPLLLRKVGENVAAFFRDFPNVASDEQTLVERLTLDLKLEDDRSQEFQYLAVPRRGGAEGTLVEYRTDDKGRPVKQLGLRGGYVLTEGFASMSIHLHPAYQPESRFRYLGKQTTKGQEAEVVAFAQRPEKARQMVGVNLDSRTLTVAIQGVAWIDTATFQIVRMRADLLEPRPDLALRRHTVVVQFGEVRFKERPQPLWLPHEVHVEIEWGRRIYRNFHRYSHFRLFSVEAEERKPAKPDQ